MQKSYFAKYRGNNGISIAVIQPKWCDYETYYPLVPPFFLLKQYKQTYNKEAYERTYYTHVLSKCNPSAIYYDLKDKVILCWERPDQFCHRHLVAQWLYNIIGIDVPEYEYNAG